MYLFYVDESGDSGPLPRSPSTHYVLSAFAVHELRWNQTLDAVIDFRRHLRLRYGLKLREEIHAGPMLTKPGDLARIPRSLRLRLLRDVLDFEASLPDVSVVNIVVDKTSKAPTYPVFEMAWKCLIQRLDNTIRHRNFPGPARADQTGLLIVDRSDEKRLRHITRRMRRYNPIPLEGTVGGSRSLLVRTFVEDPIHRESENSYLVQLADVNAFFLYQKFKPSTYVKRAGANNYFDRLEPVLCKVASRDREDGIKVL